MSQWMVTASGREYALNGPQALGHWNPPDIRDVAHHLALINRFNGATSRPYSVAEHSLLCERIAAAQGADAGLRLAALMHDAHQAYVGDVTSPAKHCLGVEWIGFEAMHKANLRSAFGLRALFAGHAGQVQQIDLIALATERRDLTAFDHFRNERWPVLDGIEPHLERLDPLNPPAEWQSMREQFLQRFAVLRSLVAQMDPEGVL